jgi:chemotaxis-related protein WspD
MTDNNCWRTIGTFGDRSCPELLTHMHCHNCPVFSRAGRSLMSSSAPTGYIEQWTTFLAGARVRENVRTLSALVFRIGEEWLAIDTAVVVEIAEVRVARRIAHRQGSVLIGMVNIRGHLLLEVSVKQLLNIVDAVTATVATRQQPRLVVIRLAEATWVFRVDEVRGVQRFTGADLGPIPVTVSHSVARGSKGLLTLGKLQVGYLDAEAMFGMLRQAVG